MKKRLLLLIEDNPLLTGMYKNAFENAGFEIIFAHDGESGLVMAKNENPEGIILDLLMPGIGGLKVLEELKKDDRTKDIKVIILAVNIKEEDKKKAREMGAIEFFIKPELTLAEIVERTTSALDKAK